MLGVYDSALVAISLMAAILASYTALDLASRVTASKGRMSWVWTCGGAFAMGTGIWSMHFIGMLSFHLQIPVAYDFEINLLSWFIAVALSAITLYVVSRPVMTIRNITSGATLMGIGICSMHYVGMLSMQMSPPIQYRPSLFITSVFIAFVASFAALWISFHFRKKHPGTAIMAKLGSASIMGIAISGMHYTGMAAAQFAPDSICIAAQSSMGLHKDTLVLIVGLATFSILSITLVISAFDGHIAMRSVKHVEDLQSANEQLRNIALYDNLTGLPNRLLLDDRIEQAIVRASRSLKHCALMFIDLDKFKPVNDVFGHHIGDELLKAVALRLLGCIRKEDTAGRTGGDEFVVVLSGLEHGETAAKISDKILVELSKPFYVKGHDLIISCSIGISIYPDDGKTRDTLIANADKAMYYAKKNGRNGYHYFSLSMNMSS